MKIAILTASFLPKVGGAQVFAHNISRQLDALGHSVHVYVPRESYLALSPPFRSLLKPLPGMYYGLVRRVPYLGLYWAQRYLRRRQWEENYDAWLVIVTSPSGYVATCLRGVVPIALRASGEDIQKSSELDYGWRLDEAVEARISRIVKSYDRVVALTDSVRTDFTELGVSDDVIVTIPNGVDVERFTQAREVREIREELGWPDDRPVILTTGRHHRKKGFDLIPSMAAQLREQGFQFRWYLVGRDTELIDWEVRSHGLGDFVQTIGQIGVEEGPNGNWGVPDSRLVMMYQASDIFAFPSLLETFGMVQLEAMAAGVVVVATDAPGCRDVVKHEENGLQARAGDAEDFANQLGRVLGEPELRKALSEKGREFVRAYSWEKVARQYEALFQDLVTSREASTARSNVNCDA